MDRLTPDFLLIRAVDFGHRNLWNFSSVDAVILDIAAICLHNAGAANTGSELQQPRVYGRLFLSEPDAGSNVEWAGNT